LNAIESNQLRVTTMLSKDEAEREAIRRFRLLPAHQRQQYEDCEAYALRLEHELEFPSFMTKRRLIAAWLIRDFAKHRDEYDEHPLVAVAEPLDEFELAVVAEAEPEAAAEAA